MLQVLAHTASLLKTTVVQSQLFSTAPAKKSFLERAKQITARCDDVASVKLGGRETVVAALGS